MKTLRRLYLALMLAVVPMLVSTGCSGGESYEITRTDTTSGHTLVAATIKGKPTDEKLKEWGKEISDKQGTAQPVTVIFFIDENKMRATYAAGMLMSMPEGGFQLPTGKVLPPATK